MKKLLAILGVSVGILVGVIGYAAYMGVNFDGMTASMKDTVSAGTVVNNYNNSRTVNQTNNSPKSLSRLEIYRQTRNAMM